MVGHGQPAQLTPVMLTWAPTAGPLAFSVTDVITEGADGPSVIVTDSCAGSGLLPPVLVTGAQRTLLPFGGQLLSKHSGSYGAESDVVYSSTPSALSHLQ